MEIQTIVGYQKLQCNPMNNAISLLIQPTIEEHDEKILKKQEWKFRRLWVM